MSAGFLTGDDIKNAINNNEIIVAPFSNENITPVGYNFSYSLFIVSISANKFKRIEINNQGELYFWIKPNETVLVLTSEAIKVPNDIGGTFHSKVSIVADGLSHISTTLDPGWSGQLLIPMNNPTNKAKKVIIGQNGDKNGFKPQFNTFITLVLFRSETKNTIKSDNISNRLDLLKQKINIVDNKHTQKQLREAVDKMGEKIVEYDVFNKNTSKTKVEKDEKFKETYTAISYLNNSLSNVISANKKNLAFQRVFFCIIALIIISSIPILLCFGLMYENVQWLASVIVPIVTSVSIVAYKPLFDKLWW